MNMLSEHFYLVEFTRSQTASRKGIRNVPGTTEINNMIVLCQAVLEPLREGMGMPIHISSGYRCLELNTAIGGSPTSQHPKGEAADLDHPTLNREIFYYILENIRVDQLIWEFGNEERPDWVHVSFTSTGRNRGQALRALRKEGRVIYEPY
jgi:zinc D-Ala-D-Ala carboxypeptidase